MRTPRHTASILLQEDGLRIPGVLVDLTSFRRWVQSVQFPEKGRIDWVGGQVEVDMAPEDLNTHGTPKVAMSVKLDAIVGDRDLGVVLVDSTRMTVPDADLSVEPDIVVVLYKSIENGRVRLVPGAGRKEGRYVEIEGPADLVVECLSDSSEVKDRRRLREQYWRAGVPEYWLVDARLDPPQLQIYRYQSRRYVDVPANPVGFRRSPCLGMWVCLRRMPARAGLVRYRLDTRTS